ncbi:MAG: HDOD domain-containing protein [FCB group bacterium]|nr:HDOD domain-containing protein [FCB group bacterium]
MNIRDQIFEKVTSFPTLPTITQRLLSIIEDPNAADAEIGRVIQYDPALTANVLKAANSAFLGFSKPVSSITEASVRVGKKWIFQIAVSSLIYSNLNVFAKGYELTAEQLWRHSMAVALMSENFGKILRLGDTGMIFTGGLVHDIGKIALHDAVDEYYDQLQEIVDTDELSFEEAERKLLGIDHAEVGALIAEHWKFSPAIIDIIRWHHYPQGAEQITSAIDIVHAADALCMMEGFGLGKEGLQYHVCQESLSRLDLTKETVETAVSRVMDSLENIEDMFSDKPAECAAVRR